MRAPDGLRTVLAPLPETELAGLAVEALVHVALGGPYGAAFYIAGSGDPNNAQRDAEAVVDAIIKGMALGRGPKRPLPDGRDRGVRGPARSSALHGRAGHRRRMVTKAQRQSRCSIG